MHSPELHRAAPDSVLPASSLHVERVILAVVAVAALLLVVADVYQRWIAPEPTWTLDIDGRFNAVTWFHSFILAGASLSAFAVALTVLDRAMRNLWLFVAAGMAFLSMDKSISLHERVGQHVEEALAMSDQSGRIIWQIIYGPFLLALAVAVIVVLVPIGGRPLLMALGAIVLSFSKLLLEASMYPLIEYAGVSERGVVYGIEVNVEETLQLFGFALFFAAFARTLIDRVAVPAAAPPDTFAAAASSIPAPLENSDTAPRPMPSLKV